MQLNVIRTDLSDNRYLECAVEGEAGFIVTGDSDLLNLEHYQSIRMATPSAFWQMLDVRAGEKLD